LESDRSIEITYIAEPEFRNRATIFYENNLISGLIPNPPTDGIDPNYKPITYKYATLAPGESLTLFTKISEILMIRKNTGLYSIFFNNAFDFHYENESRGQILTRMREESEQGKHPTTFYFENIKLKWK
jgi:hypothetical protein